MNFRTLLEHLFLTTTLLFFTACSDDDDIPTTSSLVAGAYTGTITMTFAYGTLEYYDKTIYLVPNGNNAVDISFNDEELRVMKMESVPVKRNADVLYVAPKLFD